MNLITRIRDFWYKAGDYDRLQDEHDRLQTDYGNLQKRYEQLWVNSTKMTEAARHTLEESLKLAESCRVSKEDMLERAKLNESSNASLNEWKKGEESKTVALEEENRRLRRVYLDLKRENTYLAINNLVHISNIFSDKMQLLLANNPEFGAIPFYYQGVGKSLPVYTPAFKEMFSSAIGVPEEQLRSLSLIGLLEYVEEGKRKQLERAFFHGDKLKNYKFDTVGDKPRTLYIGRSFPVRHKFFKKGRVPIGIALFFIDPQIFPPDYSLSQKKIEVRKINLFGEELSKAVQETTDALYISYDGIREVEDPRPIDEIPAKEFY